MTIAIIQARMGATRLPGKVLKKVSGKTILEHMITRVKRARTVDKIIVATTTSRTDSRIAKEAARLSVAVFRGSEKDILDRYYKTGKLFHAQDGDAIIRLTADCPLMDPAVVDRTVLFYKKHKKRFSYVSNVHPPTYPDGMDVEVFSFHALKIAWQKAKLLSEREHVTQYIVKHKKRFPSGNVRYKADCSHIRLTLDTPEDLIVIRKVFAQLSRVKKRFTLEDILRLWHKKSELFAFNQHIMRNEGYKKSLQEDKILL